MDSAHDPHVGPGHYGAAAIILPKCGGGGPSIDLDHGPGGADGASPGTRRRCSRRSGREPPQSQSFFVVMRAEMIRPAYCCTAAWYQGSVVSDAGAHVEVVINRD